MLYDIIALEKHLHVATKAERIQNSKPWILTINAEGPQQTLNKRPDFAQAKRECKRLHDEHLATTQEEYRTIPRSQQIRQRKGQQFKGNEEYDYAVDPENMLEVLQSVAVKPADKFVRVAGQPADSFVIVVNVGSNPLEDEQLEFQAFFKP